MHSRKHGAVLNRLRKMPLALLFAGLATLVMLISQEQVSAEEGSGKPDKAPGDRDDAHNFDIRGMDRTELTRAFAGQLTIVPQAVSLRDDATHKLTASATRKEIVFIDPGVPEREK